MRMQHDARTRDAVNRRMDALPKRTRLMLEWGRFCESTPMQAGEVVALHG